MFDSCSASFSPFSVLFLLTSKPNSLLFTGKIFKCLGLAVWRYSRFLCTNAPPLPCTCSSSDCYPALPHVSLQSSLYYYRLLLELYSHCCGGLNIDGADGRPASSSHNEVVRLSASGIFASRHEFLDDSIREVTIIEKMNSQILGSCVLIREK